MSRLIAVVSEDKLTQAVLHKCIAKYLPNHRVLRSDVKGGRGNVKRELGAYAKLAATMPVLIGVDLDHDTCAPDLLANWQQDNMATKNLVIRVAVREIESWVLADRKRFANFIRAASDDVPKNPDALVDPKMVLLKLARATASDELKRDLIPRNFNKYPRMGPAYNLQMCNFVKEKWRPHVALTRSNSLSRAIVSMQALAI